MTKCEASRDCGELAVVSMSWHVTVGETMVRSEGIFCSRHAREAWERVSTNPSVASTVVLRDV
mgnify:CR=1 FL=1